MQALSETLFAATAAAYFFAALLHIVSISAGRDGISRAAYLTAAGGFIAQSAGLVARYIAAGRVEVAAFEKAAGNALHGWERFTVFMSHPPFTNLYESMVFMVWGLIGVSLYLERRGRYPVIGLFSTMLAVLALGLSSLMSDTSITPLVPALQSWWLHAHVAMAATAYGAFLLAAILSFLLLVKDGAETRTIGLTLSVAAALMLLGLARGAPILTGEYFLTLLSSTGGKVSQVWVEATGEGGAPELAAKIPAGLTGLLISITFVLYIAAAALYRIFREGRGARAGFIVYTAAFVSLTATLLGFLSCVLGGQAVGSTDDLRTLLESVYPGAGTGRISGPPPYFLGMKSNPYDFALLVFLWLLGAMTICITAGNEKVKKLLPDSRTLDNAAYRVTLLAFPLMSLVIITGAVWAHYAWGRYWGWDPKETWSLITWFLYAFYLHARITHGWTGRRSAVISVIGFAVVIFTYLGVNLGLTGAGLHVYGRG